MVRNNVQASTGLGIERNSYASPAGMYHAVHAPGCHGEVVLLLIRRRLVAIVLVERVTRCSTRS